MRIRGTKPEFWKSKRIASVSWEDRLLLKGLESYVDDNGVGVDDVELIVTDVFPRDMFANPRETVARVSEGISRLHQAGLLHRYTSDSDNLLYVAFWEDIQRIDKPGKGRYPRPDGTMDYKSSVIRESVASPPETLAPVTEEQRNRGTEEQSGPAAKAGNTKRPKRPIPEDWTPTDRHVDYANERNLDLDREADAYRAHAQANDRRLVDWDAGFRQWLTNAKPRPTPGSRPPGRPEPRTFDQIRHDNTVDLWSQVKAEEGEAPWPPNQLGA